VLTSIQVTINNSHPVVVSALQHIQRWLKANGPLAHLQPTRSGNHWHLIFVLLDDMTATFQQQPFKGVTGRQEWAGNVDQYVLGVLEDMLWGRTLNV